MSTTYLWKNSGIGFYVLNFHINILRVTKEWRCKWKWYSNC